MISILRLTTSFASRHIGYEISLRNTIAGREFVIRSAFLFPAGTTIQSTITNDQLNRLLPLNGFPLVMM